MTLMLCATRNSIVPIGMRVMYVVKLVWTCVQVCIMMKKMLSKNEENELVTLIEDIDDDKLEY